MAATAPRRLPGTFDIFIEHSGAKVGYKLARSAEQGVQWFPTLEAAHAPQRVTEGFGYPSTPARVNVSLHINDWSGGAGLQQEAAAAVTTTSYSYSQGADLSTPGRIYLSPERQAGTDLSGPIRKKLFTPLGVFAITDTAVFEWDTGTDAYVSRLSSVTPTDIIAYEDLVLVAMGDANAYQYTTNGTDWTVGNIASAFFSYFAVRSGAASNPVLWGITSSGAIKNSVDPRNGTGSWSAATQIGDTWEVVNSMVVAEDTIFILKDTGIYGYDGVTKEDIFPARTQAQTENGKHPIYWVNNRVYFNFGDQLLELDPGSRGIRQVFPVPGREGHPEVNGTITAIGQTNEHVYFALKNAAGNTYLMKGNPTSGEWHTWAFLGANDCTALSGQRAGAVNASNPVMLASFGTFGSHYILPGPNLRPESDAAYRFDTTALGEVYWPWLDGGTALFSKWLTAGRIVTENTIVQVGVGTRELALAYGVDGSETLTDLAESELPGVTVGVPADADRFTWIRPRFKLTSDSNLNTPIGKGLVLDSTPNPPRHRKWRFLVDLGDFQTSARAGQSRDDAAFLEDHLFSSTSARVLLYDRRGRRFVVKMDTIEQVRLDEQAEEDDDKYLVECFEMGAQGYLSTWFGVGSKFLLPDLPGGAVGLNNDTTTPTEGDELSATFRPEVIGDHGRWAASGLNHSFIRFPNVTIPNGVTITRAYIRLRLFAVSAGILDVDLFAEDADNGVAPTTADQAELLTLTTANVRFTQALTGADAWWNWFQFTDMTDVIKEIVDRPNWTSGNALMVVGRQRSVAGTFWSRWFTTQEFAGSNQEIVPELFVEWTE